MSEFPFYSPELSREVETPIESATAEVQDILSDPRLHQEILDGNITLAMIRPNVGPEANLLGLPDIQAAEKIEEMIEGLGIVAKFSFEFSLSTVEEFYGGDPKESMSKGEARDQTNYENRWLEFADFMATGNTTAILLYSPDGDAIQRWRDHLGHWNIDQVRDETTIRGILGVDKFNNLVHGSDSPQAVLREIDLISHCLKQS